MEIPFAKAMQTTIHLTGGKARQIRQQVPADAKRSTLAVRPDKGPLVAIQIVENGNGSIALLHRRPHPLHAGGSHCRVIPRKVICIQEKKHAAAGLSPDGGVLLVGRGLRQ